MGNQNRFFSVYEYTHTHLRAALKVMTPILLCQPMTSEVDVGGMAVEVEPSRQYSVLLPCDRWQQRGTLTPVVSDM